MKICYVNDEQESVAVRVNHQFTFDPNNPLAEPKCEWIKLEAGDSKVFDIDAPEGAIPYVKRWERRVVLLSYILPDALEHIQAFENTLSAYEQEDT